MSIQSISASPSFQPSPAPAADVAATVGALSARQSGTLTPQAVREATATDASTAAQTQAADPLAQEAQREDTLTEAISSVEEYIKPFNNRLEFSIDDDVGRVVVKVVDKETEDVILQIPSEEMLAIAKALDNIKGLFIKQQA